MQVAYGQGTYLKKFIWEVNIRSDIFSLPPVCICSYLDGNPSPLSENLIIECPLMWYVRFSKYFCSFQWIWGGSHKSCSYQNQRIILKSTRFDFKICQYLCFHMKIISRKFHISTPFTFWDTRTWDIRKVAQKIESDKN